MFAWLKALFGGRNGGKPNGQDGPAVPIECLEQAPEILVAQDLAMETAAQEAEDRMREVAKSSTQTLDSLRIDAEELHQKLKDLPPLGPIAR